MPKKSPRTVSFAAVLKSLEPPAPDDGPLVLSPAGSGGSSSTRTVAVGLSAGPLGRAAAKRLFAQPM